MARARYLVAMGLLALAGCERLVAVRDRESARDDAAASATATASAGASARARAAAAARAKSARLCEKPTDLVLGFSLQGTHGATFEEQTTIDCAGKVRHVTTAPLAAGAIGLFEAQLGADRAEQARRLARELLAEPDFVPSLPPQGADLTVSVHAKPNAASWALRPSSSAVHDRASVLRGALIGQAQRKPVAVLSFSAALSHGQLALIVTHGGDKPVQLSIAERGVRVLTSGGPGSGSFEAKPALGFVTGEAKLLDGLHVPATFSGGVRAGLIVEPPAAPGATSARIELSGRVALPGDGERPERVLRVVTEPVKLR